MAVEYYVKEEDGTSQYLLEDSSGSLLLETSTLTTHPVSRITQLGGHGVPSQVYSSFAGKPAASSGPHNVVRLTQLGAWAVSLPRYAIGAFAGKPAGAAGGGSTQIHHHHHANG